ncbi:transposable element Tcb2 transposase [Trichonephila clavipes]|uniref:Transposable element Tcb2 transposase n=1 Tax=Trichonephila clavipes TaxID=2585209 RepID=A0A8X6V0B9_TRICX|nr:transposable element Tcb2 transposase [Trichonephila clavipes]
MARRNHLDDFTRGRMFGKLEEGRIVTSVAAEFGINKSVVSRAWKAFQTTSTAVRKVNGGHSRTTTAGDDRNIILQWCREHKNWATDQWSRVLFKDGNRFSTRSDSQRVLIWREIGTQFYTKHFKKRHHYGGLGVLVWVGIMLNGRTELHIFDRGSVTGDRYCEEVLLPRVHLFRGAIGPDFIFMDGNARPHQTLAVEELLEREDITQMDWPAYSPDLNPIEHVWDALGRRIAARLHHLEYTQQLKQMLIEEWVLLPEEMLHQLVLTSLSCENRKKSGGLISGKAGGCSICTPPLSIFVGQELFGDIGCSWLEIYANLQFPKTPKSISDKTPYRSVTPCSIHRHSLR